MRHLNSQKKIQIFRIHVPSFKKWTNILRATFPSLVPLILSPKRAPLVCMKAVLVLLTLMYKKCFAKAILCCLPSTNISKVVHRASTVRIKGSPKFCAVLLTLYPDRICRFNCRRAGFKISLLVVVHLVHIIVYFLVIASLARKTATTTILTEVALNIIKAPGGMLDAIVPISMDYT